MGRNQLIYPVALVFILTVLYWLLLTSNILAVMLSTLSQFDDLTSTFILYTNDAFLIASKTFVVFLIFLKDEIVSKSLLAHEIIVHP